MTGNAVAVATVQMQDYFPTISATAIEAFVTAPSLAVVMLVLLSPKLASLFGKKKVIAFGLACCGVGGVAPLLISDFTLLIISRVLLGVGLGSFNSIGVSIISDFFEGKEQTKLVGYQNAVQNAGAAILTFIAGILVGFHWRLPFLIYLVAIPILLFFVIIFPDQKAKAVTIKEKQTITLSMILYGICTFFILTFFIVVYTRLGFAVREANLSNQELLGAAMAFITVGGFLAGMVYGKLDEVLKSYLPVVAFVAVGIAFLLLSQAPNMLVVTILLGVIGFGVTLVIVNIFNTLLATVPKGSETLAISLAMLGTNGGSFASPFVIALGGHLFGNTTALFSFILSGGVFIIFGILFLGINMKRKNHGQIN